MHIVYNKDFIFTIIKITTTIIAALISNTILRSFIRFPKHLGNKRSETFVTVLRNLVSVVVYVVALHYMFIELGINIAPLLASAGIIGIAVGIGARPLIEDLISGIFLLGQAAITIGDYVNINDTEGFIEVIGVRTISIRDQAGALHIIPNGLVKTVVNYSRGKMHVFIDIPVKADQPIQVVLSETEKALEKIQEEDAHSVYPGSKVLGIDNFAQGNIMVIRIDVITSAHTRWEVSKKLRLLIKKGFEKHKITIA